MSAYIKPGRGRRDLAVAFYFENVLSTFFIKNEKEFYNDQKDNKVQQLNNKILQLETDTSHKQQLMK